MSTQNSEAEKVSYDPHTTHTDEEYLQILRDLRDELGRQPYIKDLKKANAPSNSTYQKHFGSWHEALEAAGIEIETVSSKTRTRGEIKQKIQDLADELGEPPSQREFENHANISSLTVRKRFDTWNAALKCAGVGVRCPDRYNRQGEDNPNWTGGYIRYYGESWFEARREARQRDDFSCQRCGMPNEKHVEKTSMQLHVHHIQKFKSFDNHEEANQLSNLVTLCVDCHKTLEGLPIDNR